MELWALVEGACECTRACIPAGCIRLLGTSLRQSTAAALLQRDHGARLQRTAGGYVHVAGAGEGQCKCSWGFFCSFVFIKQASS